MPVAVMREKVLRSELDQTDRFLHNSYETGASQQLLMALEYKRSELLKELVEIQLEGFDR